MQILMFGWEFPPRISGGLGTACYGITRGLTELGHKILFVMPHSGTETPAGIVEPVDTAITALAPDDGIESAPWKGIELCMVAAMLRPYLQSPSYRSILTGAAASRPAHSSASYGGDLIAESIRYGKAAGAVARSRRFDIIHAHDWMSVFAGIEAKEAAGRPLVLHIHSLEFDRAGEKIDRAIYDIERHGMDRADRIIAVSNYTRGMITDRYGIDPEKIAVIHNAVLHDNVMYAGGARKNAKRKVVLFLGRVTLQKGPDYFIEAASLVLRELPEVTFVMAGDGDLLPRMVERVAELGIGRSFHFTGFLTAQEVKRMYALADLYVMPSVSEPFGIAPLEALCYGVPVIISRNSGVLEVLRHVIKVDFWDAAQIADKIIAILRRPALAAHMVAEAREEIRHIGWDGVAEKIQGVYHSLMSRQLSARPLAG